jgi:hypothetical protein
MCPPLVVEAPTTTRLSSERFTNNILHAEEVQHSLLSSQGPLRYLDLTSQYSGERQGRAKKRSYEGNDDTTANRNRAARQGYRISADVEVGMTGALTCFGALSPRRSLSCK